MKKNKNKEQNPAVPAIIMVGFLVLVCAAVFIATKLL